MPSGSPPIAPHDVAPPLWSVQASSTTAIELCAAGELDLTNDSEFAASLAVAVEEADLVVLDLSEVTFMGAQGPRAVLAARERAREKGGRLVVAALSGPAALVFDLMGVRDR